MPNKTILFIVLIGIFIQSCSVQIKERKDLPKAVYKTSNKQAIFTSFKKVIHYSVLQGNLVYLLML
ncbi:MAG: hypothetical protein JHC31_14130 [Sulfurihydrogenibium sp.]|nr:hypothetical protein [Sulfurihydrogenibium sp.]